MWGKLKSTFLADLKNIFLNNRLLIILSILVLIVILLPVCFSSVSHTVYLKTGLQPEKFYTIVSLSVLALIPVLVGIAYGRVISDETQKEAINGTEIAGKKVPDSTFFRILTSLIFSFLLIVLSTYLMKPVPSQGWLRTLYGVLLLTVQTPIVLLLIGKTGARKIAGTGISKFYLLFLIALPLGLLVHHPWNCLAFFSPFYWVAWAWMIRPPAEAVICGAIAIILSSVILFVLLKYFLGRHRA
jgi:hypothetical protein